MNKNREMSMLIIKVVFSTPALLAVILQVTPARGAPQAYADAVIADHPIGYWRLGEPLGSMIAADSSVDPITGTLNGHNGTCSPSGITFGQPGFHGGDTAALFDGLNGRIVVPNSLALNPKNITMEAKISWSGPNPGPTQYQQRIIEKSSYAGLSDYALMIVDGHVHVELRTGNAPTSVNLDSVALVPKGVETYIAATYDGDKIRIYVNGALDSEKSAPGALNPDPPPDRPGLGIGNENDPTRPRPFYGVIDEVALFDKPLSSDRIQAHYQSQLGFQYAVKFVCGTSKGQVVAPGQYFTAINVHNPNEKGVAFRKKFAVALPGERPGPVSKFSDVKLGPDQALEIDCPDILSKTDTKEGFLKGFVVIESALELDVVAVYTAAGATGRVDTMEVEPIKPRP
jgi:Concanavalin A-like lectin/glucanases superfamily